MTEAQKCTSTHTKNGRKKQNKQPGKFSRTLFASVLEIQSKNLMMNCVRGARNKAKYVSMIRVACCTRCDLQFAPPCSCASAARAGCCCLTASVLPVPFPFCCTSLISECSTMLHGIDSFVFIVSFMLTVSTSHFPNAFAIFFLQLPFSLDVVYSRSFCRSLCSLKRKRNVMFASEFVFSLFSCFVCSLFFFCIALCPGEHFSRCPSKMPLLACVRSTGWGTSMLSTNAPMCCSSNHIILP